MVEFVKFNVQRSTLNQSRGAGEFLSCVVTCKVCTKSRLLHNVICLCVCGCFFFSRVTGRRVHITSLFTHTYPTYVRVPIFQRGTGVRSGISGSQLVRVLHSDLFFLIWIFCFSGSFMLFLRVALSWGLYSAFFLVSFSRISCCLPQFFSYSLVLVPLLYYLQFHCVSASLPSDHGTLTRGQRSTVFLLAFNVHCIHS
jgi:hypothetical protein